MSGRGRRRLFGRLLVAASLLPAAAAHSEPRIRVAILGFKDYPGKVEAKGVGASFGRLLAVAIGSDAAVNQRLQIVEREELRLVLDEKKLAASGVLDPATTHTTGRLLGVSYFITGGVEAFSKTRDRKGVPPFRADFLEAKATISVRFIDTRSATQALAFNAEAKSSDKLVSVDTKDPTRKAEWSRSTEEGLLEELLKRAANQAVKELKKLDRLRSLKPIEIVGRVVKVEAKRAWFNLGTEAGVVKGRAFSVLRLGKPLIDRATGAVLGADETELDGGEVESVSERVSVLRLRLGRARVNDMVRPVAAEEAAAEASPASPTPARDTKRPKRP